MTIDGNKFMSDAIQAGAQPTEYEIPNTESSIKLLHDELVWGPYSAGYFLKILSQKGIFDKFQNISLLDLGSGSGILGITALAKGAKFVTMSDFNQNAVALSSKNAALNGFEEGSNFESINSDAFSHITGIYETIISNPPVQPELPGVHTNNPAYKSNESGINGRGVLDQLIKEGKSHLLPNGQMIFSASSRHGHQQTTRLMNKFWGESNWRVINSNEYGEGKEDVIMTDYHGPYMLYWVGLQMMDMDFRVYQKDRNGLPICDAQLTEERGMRLVTVPSSEGNRTLKLDIISGKVVKAVELTDQVEKAVELPEDFVLPTVGEDKNWYYKYYIIEADNVGSEVKTLHPITPQT